MYQPELFPGQQPDESIVIVLHRHWFIFISRIIQVVGLILLPSIILVVALTWTGFTLQAGTLSYVLLVMGSSLYLLFLSLLLYGYWLDYALDVFIVSDKRVVDIEQSGLFNRSVAEQRLYRVQDVTYEVKGVIRTFLKFGDVHIQTAGREEHFIFEDVPNPDRVTELILQQVDKQQAEHPEDLSDPNTIMHGKEPPPYHQHPAQPDAKQ